MAYRLDKVYLVASWWLNHPFEKYAYAIRIYFPNFRGENKKQFETHEPENPWRF